MIIQRTSDAVDCLNADFIRGVVTVLFNNGSVYTYRNVSRRAIANLQLQPNMSLGFWINENLLKSKRVREEQRYSAIPTANYPTSAVIAA